MLSWSLLRAKLYDGLITGLSLLHYAVLSRFSASDEGGMAWFRRRLSPILPSPGAGPRIWIHAVSAGESKIAESLRDQLRERGIEVVLSSTTYAGYARIRAVAGSECSFIMPLDTLPAQRRVFSTVRPDLLVLVESEFWPAQFAAAAAAAVPIVVVNATLSERSFAGHRRFPALSRATVLQAVKIHAQDEAVAARYRALGVLPSRLEICGSLKLAPPPGRATPPPNLPGRDTGPMVTFGNLHLEELDVLGPAVRELGRRRPDLRIVLVPRYPGKIPPELLTRHFGQALTIVSDVALIPGAGDLVWLDQMGSLAQVYAASTIGVVCGTFGRTGGHDLAEPLQLGAASVYGPRVERQGALSRELASLGCATQVESASQLPLVIDRLLQNEAGREAAIRRFAELSAAASQRLAAIADELAGLARDRR